MLIVANIASTMALSLLGILSTVRLKRTHRPSSANLRRDGLAVHAQAGRSSGFTR